MLPNQIPERGKLHFLENLQERLLIVNGNGFKQLELCCSHDLDRYISQAVTSVPEIVEEDEDSDHPY